jgi:phosphotriesterase-related protein
MPHEHILLLNPSFVEPLEASERHRAHEPVSEENIEWVRQYWTSNVDNLELYDEDVAREEAARYFRAGGDSIIETTTRYIARDPRALVRISRGSGVNIVAGTGFYVAETHPPDMDARSDRDLADEMIGELTRGIDDTGVQAGFIGEMGCFWPLRDNERKALRGAAMASLETGAAVMVHPGRHPDAPAEILSVLLEVGMAADKVIIAHMERTILESNAVLELADTGCYLEYDVFGQETSMYPTVAQKTEVGIVPSRPAGLSFVSDAQRLEKVDMLVGRGHAERLLISMDICTKHRLHKYGGHGYDHILENIVPWMRRRGTPEDTLDMLLVQNPRRIFTMKAG